MVKSGLEGDKVPREEQKWEMRREEKRRDERREELSRNKEKSKREKSKVFRHCAWQCDSTFTIQHQQRPLRSC
jgi:hypothetical protein